MFDRRVFPLALIATLFLSKPLKAFRWPCLSPPQSPVPGLSDNKLALSGLSSHSFASGGGSRFTVMFGQTRAYSALMPSHFSSQSQQIRLYFLGGTALWLIETMAFNWNMTAQSTAEKMFDTISGVLMLYGFICGIVASIGPRVSISAKELKL